MNELFYFKHLTNTKLLKKKRMQTTLGSGEKQIFEFDISKWVFNANIQNT